MLTDGVVRLVGQRIQIRVNVSGEGQDSGVHEEDEDVPIFRLEMGTVRYDGPVPVGASNRWLGIEWDNPERGKHSGEHKGHQYFTCSRPGTGSFVKYPSKVIETGRSFCEALRSKYEMGNSTFGDRENRKFGDTEIAVELVGFDKIAKKQKLFQRLLEVGLSAESINGAGTGDEEDIKNLCPQIRDLDLSKNLLADWPSVGRIARQLEHLESLRLGFNRLEPLPCTGEPVPPQLIGAFPTLFTLALDHTYIIDWNQLELLGSCFPRLDSLHFGFNALTKLSADRSNLVERFGNLSLLNLESNLLTDWAEIEPLSVLPNLRSLYLQNNRLQSIEYAGGFDQLTFLNLLGNQFNDWHAVNELNKFPRLCDLRLRDVPLVTGLDKDDIRLQLLGRLGKITVLNGAAINQRYRLDYEIYYLKKCYEQRAEGLFADEDSMRRQHPRFEELLEKHGQPVFDLNASSGKIKDHLFDVMLTALDGAGRSVVKRLPGTTKIRVLKSVIQKTLGIPLKRQQLLIENDYELDDDMRDLLFYSIDGSTQIQINIKQI